MSSGSCDRFGCMLRCCLASSLFPYTTFFRSLDLLIALIDKSLVVSEETTDGVRYRMLEPVRQHALELLDGRVRASGSEPHRWSDRKSTRLNSSHANISYAVFCLKKTNQLGIR